MVIKLNQFLILLVCFLASLYLPGEESLEVKNEYESVLNEIIENTFILLFLRIIIIFPLYQLVLISIATIFGEFNYFLSFERSMLKKLFKKLK